MDNRKTDIMEVRYDWTEGKKNGMKDEEEEKK